MTHERESQVKLEGTADILDHHIMEAIAYRNLDRPSYLGTSL